MRSEFDLLSSFFDALSQEPHAFDTVKLQYPAPGFDSIEEMRRAVRIAHSRGFIQYPEEGIDGVFHLDLTEEGRDLLPPASSVKD
jgi:hypothetical protein